MHMLYDEFSDLKEKAKHGDFMLPFVEYGVRIPDYFTSFPMHWHDEMEIILVNEGAFEINVDLENYVARKGDIIILRPCTLHAFKQYKKESVRYHTILFDVSMLHHDVTDACFVKYFKPFLENQFAYPIIIKPEYEGQSAFVSYIQALLKLYEKKEPFFELEIKAQLYSMFRLFFQEFCTMEEKQLNIKSEAVENIKIVLDYMKEHYAQNITIHELANLLHFSEQYFMRFFKKHTGMTCVDYINDYRLNRATDLLAGTDITIMEIAMKVGMNNVSYFNRMFKRKFQITPRDYRKRMRE